MGAAVPMGLFGAPEYVDLTKSSPRWGSRTLLKIFSIIKKFKKKLFE
jgi:hypothetical protein